MRKILVYIGFISVLLSCKSGKTTEKVQISDGNVTIRMDEYTHAFRNPMKGFREFFSPGLDNVREE